MRRVRALHWVAAAIAHVGNATRLQSRAKLGAVAIAKRWSMMAAWQAVMLNQDKRVTNGGRHCRGCARLFESLHRGPCRPLAISPVVRWAWLRLKVDGAPTLGWSSSRESKFDPDGNMGRHREACEQGGPYRPAQLPSQPSPIGRQDAAAFE